MALILSHTALQTSLQVTRERGDFRVTPSKSADMIC